MTQTNPSSAPTEPPPRPLGFVSVDIDGLWAIRKCYHQPIGHAFTQDPVWSQGVPWLLDTFQTLGIRATFFVIARDLEVDWKREIAQRIVNQGHEVGNHSLSHHIGLSRLPMGEVLDELRAAQQMIEETLDHRPVGFRSPGYDIDARLLRAVRRVGFQYDSSLLPTWWTPLLRLADWWVARRIDFKKRQFGRLSYGRAPLEPYRPIRHKIRRDSRSKSDIPFWEIQVGVTPSLRLPIGAGYVLTAGEGFLRRSIRTLSARAIPVHFLVHGADVVDLTERESRVFPSRGSQPRAAGFALQEGRKRAAIENALRALAESLTLQRLQDWVAAQPHTGIHS